VRKKATSGIPLSTLPRRLFPVATCVAPQLAPSRPYLSRQRAHTRAEREKTRHTFPPPPPPLTPAMAAVPPPDPAHLADLAAAGAALFQLDDDRAVCGRDYQINLQGVVHGYDGAVRDAAPGPLFALSPDLLRRYAPFVALLDNFTAQV